MKLRSSLVPILFCAALCAQTAAPPPCAGLPPGRHALLERLTAQLTLTCEQQVKIEPILHDEESVTKPLLAFTSLSTDDQQDVMTMIKLAARRQVRTHLTAEQQKGMDSEVDSVSKGGKKGGGKKGATKAPEVVPGLAGEEALSLAVTRYSALTDGERKKILLKVKLAARSDPALQLSGDQQHKMDAEIQALQR